MNPLRAVAPALLVALAVACESTTAVTDGVVSVTHESGSLVIRNTAAVPVSYVAIHVSLLPLFDWIPCSGPRCPTIPAHGSVTRADSTIYGYSADSHGIAMWWWRAEPDSTVQVPWDAVHQVNVTF